MQYVKLLDDSCALPLTIEATNFIDSKSPGQANFRPSYTICHAGYASPGVLASQSLDKIISHEIKTNEVNLYTLNHQIRKGRQMIIQSFSAEEWF
jgi:hypothetical protein